MEEELTSTEKRIPPERLVLDLDKDPPEEQDIGYFDPKEFKPSHSPGLYTAKVTLVEEIIAEGKPAFVVAPKGGEPKQAKSVIYGNILYLPLEDELLQKKLIKLPSWPIDYRSELELREGLLELIRCYVDILDPYPELCCDYVMQTWLYDRTKVQPILNPRGPIESGKSRLREVLFELCYRGMNLGGAMTAASMFRSAEVWKGTLCIDEGDLPRSKEDISPVKILNMRYQHDGAVWRVNKETMKLHAFRIFGPTVLCSRRGFFDDALESRCIVVPMEETERSDIPLTPPPEFYDRAQELRNKLLAFRLRHFHGFEVDDSIRFPGVGKRLNQMLQPMASLARELSQELYAKIESTAGQLYERQVEERAHSEDGFIVRAYLELCMEGKADITPTDLSERIKERFRYELEPKALGRRLLPLGFRRWKTTGGLRVVKLEGKPFRRAFKRMVPKDERETWEEHEFKLKHAKGLEGTLKLSEWH